MDEPLRGCRVFFTRRGQRLLASYWCQRWDDLALREQLSLPYTPRYWVEAEALDGLFVQLRRLPYLWFKGLFSVGRHRADGRYLQVPVNLTLAGLGPREAVFPASLAAGLGDVQLIADWPRYQWCVAPGRELEGAPQRDRRERLAVRARRLRFGPPRPLGRHRWVDDAHRLVPVGSTRPTLNLVGTVLGVGSPLDGREIDVPLKDVLWKSLTR